jgi:hypothetical protein
MTLLAVLVACGKPAVPAPVEAAQVEARDWIEASNDRGGTLVIQTSFDPAGQVALPTPEVQGMTFEAPVEPDHERVGSREVVTQRFAWTAAKGSYEIPALNVHWKGADSEADAATSPLYVDLGVPPPGREGDLADIHDPKRIWTIPWLAIGVTAGVTGLLLGGVLVAFRAGGRRGAVVLPPESPDVVALRQWEAIRSDPSLDDYAKAVHLSRIFRVYAEAVLAFPASAWTTSEILERLGLMAHLPEGNIPRARRLLRATDRVKFAGERAGVDLFEELDSDLRAFIGTTRPHRVAESP